MREREGGSRWGREEREMRFRERGREEGTER